MQRENLSHEEHGAEHQPAHHLDHADHAHHAHDDQTVTAAAGEYTCPMHPEVRQAGPGKCPKCGMFLEPVGAPSSHAQRHGHSHGHEHHSQRHPHTAMTKGSAAAPAPAVKDGQDVEYTCPMHPEIRQMGPGNCPICGMALEPVLATGEAGESPELRDMTRRFWIGLALTLPVLFLEMGGHLFDIGHLVRPQTSNWIQMLFGTPVVLWAGWPFFVRGWQSEPPRDSRRLVGLSQSIKTDSASWR